MLAFDFLLVIQASIQCVGGQLPHLALLVFLELVLDRKVSISQLFLALHPCVGTVGRQFVGSVDAFRLRGLWRTQGQTCRQPAPQTEHIDPGRSDVVSGLACDRSREALSGWLDTVARDWNPADHCGGSTILVQPDGSVASPPGWHWLDQLPLVPVALATAVVRDDS